jgi:HPt (histidine-containing phosphotransfer) domain-containing protein
MDYSFINTNYLETVAGGDKELIRELVSMFREQVAEINTEMRRLLLEKDFRSLGLLAHKAKSSVAIMGMDELALLLKTFELQAREGKEDQQYESYISRFESDTAAAVSELEDLVSNL